MDPLDQCEAIVAMLRNVTDEGCIKRAIRLLLRKARTGLDEAAADRVYEHAINEASRLQNFIPDESETK